MNTYCRKFRNTFGNMLKIVTVENEEKIPYIFGNMFGKAYDNVW